MLQTIQTMWAKAPRHHHLFALLLCLICLCGEHVQAQTTATLPNYARIVNGQVTVTADTIISTMTLAELPASLPINDPATIVTETGATVCEYWWGVVFDIDHSGQKWSVGDIEFTFKQCKAAGDLPAVLPLNSSFGDKWLVEVRSCTSSSCSATKLGDLSAYLSISGNQITFTVPKSLYAGLANISSSTAYYFRAISRIGGVFIDHFPDANTTPTDSTITTSTIIPIGLSITAPPRLQSTGHLTLEATATLNNNTSKAVQPTWTSSNPAVASVSASGILSAGTVTEDTPITLHAHYTENSTQVTASAPVIITAAPATLTGLALSGGSTVSSSGLLRVQTTATYADGSKRNVNPATWEVFPTDLGTVNRRGEFEANTVSADTPVTLTAIYMEGSVERSAKLNLTIKVASATLTSLAIIAGQGMIAPLESISLAAESGYADGSRKRIAALWSLSNTTAASITPAGVLTARAVVTDTPVVVSAQYAEGGKTLATKYSMIVQATATPPKLTAEVSSATNAQNLTNMHMWFNTDALASVHGTRVGGGFKAYVAALVPAGPLVGTSTFFLLNRSKEWQTIAWPLAEFLSGVNQNEWQFIELLDSIDTSIISGAQIFVGYGVTDTEMLEAGRYQLVYQVP